MNKFILFTLGSVLFFQINSFATNQGDNYSVVEVITPSKEVYDDGIYRVKFSSFYVIDEEGNKIISSGEVFDYAAKIKLKEGSYKIFYENLSGKILHKELKVEKGNCLQINLN
mgnify:FL=1